MALQGVKGKQNFGLICFLCEDSRTPADISLLNDSALLYSLVRKTGSLRLAEDGPQITVHPNVILSAVPLIRRETKKFYNIIQETPRQVLIFACCLSLIVFRMRENTPRVLYVFHCFPITMEMSWYTRIGSFADATASGMLTFCTTRACITTDYLCLVYISIRLRFNKNISYCVQ